MTERAKMRFQVSVIYRHIQLLSILCSEIQQKILMVSLICSTIVVSSFCLATLAHISFNTDNFSVMCILLCTYLDSTFASLFCFGGMVSVNQKSKVFIQKLKSRRSSSQVEMENLWIRKFARACMPIKMKFGENNFFESLTPLKCLNCAARLTIQILLCERRHGGFE